MDRYPLPGGFNDGTVSFCEVCQVVGMAYAKIFSAISIKANPDTVAYSTMDVVLPKTGHIFTL
jgi:hypothetical protein